MYYNEWKEQHLKNEDENILDELGILDRTVGVASVGCSVFSYNYFIIFMFCMR